DRRERYVERCHHTFRRRQQSGGICLRGPTGVYSLDDAAGRWATGRLPLCDGGRAAVRRRQGEFGRQVNHFRYMVGERTVSCMEKSSTGRDAEHLGEYV